MNIDEPLARVKADGTVRFYQQDALGSVVALTDESGAIKTQYVYDPFGNVTVSGEASDNPIQFVGKENDGTGLMKIGVRYYSIELQRFISEDPIRLSGGDINYYAYASNNPVNFTDPLGLYGWDEFLQDSANFSAGFGDTITFGGTAWIRSQWNEAFDLEDSVNRCSGSYMAGEWASFAHSIAFGLAGGIRAAGTRAAGREFSHLIPARWGGPRSLLNGNYVTIAQHALSDPYRYGFMPQIWRMAHPLPNVFIRLAMRLPRVWIGAIGGGAYGGTGMAVNN